MPRPLTRKRSHPTCEAVLALRQALGQTQQQFAVTLGLSLASVARYETTRSPDPKNLLRLAKLAEEHKRADLAQVFQRALSEPRTRVATVDVLPGEEEDFEVLQMLLRNPAYAKLRAQWQALKDSALDQQFERGSAATATAARTPAPAKPSAASTRPSLPNSPRDGRVAVRYTPAEPEIRRVFVGVVEPEKPK